MIDDQFFPCDIATLLEWILNEERKGSIFSIPEKCFYVPRKSDPFRMPRYGQMLAKKLLTLHTWLSHFITPNPAGRLVTPSLTRSMVNVQRQKDKN